MTAVPDDSCTLVTAVPDDEDDSCTLVSPVNDLAFTSAPSASDSSTRPCRMVSMRSQQSQAGVEEEEKAFNSGNLDNPANQLAS